MRNLIDTAGVVHSMNQFCAEGMEGARPFCDVTIAAVVHYVNFADTTVTCMACLGGAEDRMMTVARIYYDATFDSNKQHPAEAKREAIRRFWKIHETKETP